ncbi:hypothetical protein DFA_03382 [Cavenderia fasciculata]|uniref:Uncharacterized protein n=1 Tax=Cavenderia fasciculata TaxID=261658 RepID=F4PHF1_CACFS|nr:uncharacterized protein DFA_03382 [Cavenderia fasciculata]EGG25135.1 hypothetical protein DFA_03382 [Cavenderia fasciculata]|eukprot:XP_004362986.1 hypothetical protein DFA_03382 [Cavenderia fasciculata]
MSDHRHNHFDLNNNNNNNNNLHHNHFETNHNHNHFDLNNNNLHPYVNHDHHPIHSTSNSNSNLNVHIPIQDDVSSNSSISSSSNYSNGSISGSNSSSSGQYQVFEFFGTPIIPLLSFLQNSVDYINYRATREGEISPSIYNDATRIQVLNLLDIRKVVMANIKLVDHVFNMSGDPEFGIQIILSKSDLTLVNMISIGYLLLVLRIYPTLLANIDKFFKSILSPQGFLTYQEECNLMKKNIVTHFDTQFFWCWIEHFSHGHMGALYKGISSLCADYNAKYPESQINFPFNVCSFSPATSTTDFSNHSDPTTSTAAYNSNETTPAVYSTSSQEDTQTMMEDELIDDQEYNSERESISYCLPKNLWHLKQNEQIEKRVLDYLTFENQQFTVEGCNAFSETSSLSFTEYMDNILFKIRSSFESTLSIYLSTSSFYWFDNSGLAQYMLYCINVQKTIHAMSNVNREGKERIFDYMTTVDDHWKYRTRSITSTKECEEKKEILLKDIEQETNHLKEIQSPNQNTLDRLATLQSINQYIRDNLASINSNHDTKPENNYYSVDVLETKFNDLIAGYNHVIRKN